MAWVRIDDQLFTNRKIVAVPPSARLLYVAGLCFSAGALTDGRIPDGALPQLVAQAGAKQADVRHLVAAGLWEHAGDGHDVPDYLDYNPSSKQILDERKKEREKKRRQRANGAGKAVRNGTVQQDDHGRFVSRQESPGDTGRDSPRESPGVSPSTPSPSPYRESSSEEPLSRPTTADDEHTHLDDLLTATWQRLADHDLARLLHDDPDARIRNRTAWLNQAATERQDRHQHDARAHCNGLDRLPSPVDLAEILDPSCGPDDGGAARAQRAVEETAERAQAEQADAAEQAAWTAKAEEQYAALPADERATIDATAESLVPDGAPLRHRVVQAVRLQLVMGETPDLGLGQVG